MAALALGDEHPLLARMHIGQPQAKYLAAAQPAQQHRLDHRPVPVRAQRGQEHVRLAWVDHPRQRPRRPDQRHPTHRPRPSTA
jgi:hypothetical protein